MKKITFFSFSKIGEFKNSWIPYRMWNYHTFYLRPVWAMKSRIWQLFPKKRKYWCIDLTDCTSSNWMPDSFKVCLKNFLIMPCKWEGLSNRRSWGRPLMIRLFFRSEASISSILTVLLWLCLGKQIGDEKHYKMLNQAKTLNNGGLCY